MPKLLHKLDNLGIKGKLFACIKSFLTDCSQRVKVGNSVSNSQVLLSGVPQGSVLGPFLFLLFINDLPDIFDNDFNAKLFADDAKFYNLVDYRMNPLSTERALNALLSWSDTWQMKLAVSKCGSLLLKGNLAAYEDENELFVNNEPLAIFSAVKDLGVLVDSKLNFSSHIDSIISKAKQRIYLIFKSFITRDIKVMTFAYKTYILPILEYCSSVWNPAKLEDIDKLESVQRYFTKRLHGLWQKSYKERLIACSLQSLELRRLIMDIVLCFKIVHGLVALNCNDFFAFDPNCVTRGHNFKLINPKWDT